MQTAALAQYSLVRASTYVCGQEPNGASRQASASGNGNLIAFTSSATNLVAADTNGFNDVFVHDGAATTTYLVSVPMTGQGNGASDSPSIDELGSHVAFSSLATNLVTGTTTTGRQVFLWTRATGNSGVVTLVSHNLAGASGTGTSAGPSISADGQWVAFYSFAADLVTGDTNGKADAFVYQVSTGAITRVSLGNGPLGVQGDMDSYPRDITTSPDISVTNGGERGTLLVAFQSLATNLVPSDTNGVRDVFVRDVFAGTTTLVSVSVSGFVGHGASAGPDISRSGRYVAFLSDATDMVTGDTNGWTDVFVRDLSLATTTRVSVATGGAQCIGSGTTPAYEFMPMISYNGTYVSFDSDLKSLVTNEPIQKENVFVHDTSVVGGTTTLASVNSSPKGGNDDSSGNTLAQDESSTNVALQSAATDLIYGDENSLVDVFATGTPVPFVNYCFGDGSGTACPCGNTGLTGRGCNNAQNTGGGVLYAYGNPSISNDSFGLRGEHLPPATDMLFFQGTSFFPTSGSGAGLGVPFGDGLRCVGGAIIRLATKTVSGSADYSICQGDQAVHVKGLITVPGTSYFYQGWYRQAVMYCTGATYNLTNGVTAVWGP